VIGPASAGPSPTTWSMQAGSTPDRAADPHFLAIRSRAPPPHGARLGP
jgi:hypothetical protein